MIIDLILDRQDGANYNPKSFYDSVCNYGAIGDDISLALDSGSEVDVKRELSKYIIDNDYNYEIIGYIQSQTWL